VADSAWVPNLVSSEGAARPPLHSLAVRVTHWLSALAFFALLLTGVEIVISHPRFYWGDTGNSATPPLFQIPIPASRATVPTGYSYVLPDQNGWSRALHFQAAWLLVLTGFFYLLSGRLARLLPSGAELSAPALRHTLLAHLRLRPPDSLEYNVLQKIAYLKVVFLLVPLMIWTGLAMSPAFTAAFPFTVELLGGHQSARTIHFFAALALVLFLLAHLFMVWRAGFLSRTRAMITGHPPAPENRP
jgi:thiosulfate reductase cytochrome b subunit